MGALALMLVMAPLQAASAQDVKDIASPPAADGQLGEIVVTAEKRPSLAQKTAIAMTVVDSDTLKKNGVGNIKDLTSILPSVSFSQVNASVVIGIRGVVSRDTTNPAVSLSYDGFYTQVADGLNMSMFDIERVEVLRGPQGTLLGRNATAGAVNVITAQPADHFGAYVSGEIGNYSTYNTTGMVNIPVSDKVQVRAVFQTRDHDGYRKNPVGRDGDDEHSKAARLSASFEPTDRWKATVTGEYAHVSDVGPVVQAVPQTYTGGTLDLGTVAIPGGGKSFSSPDGGYERGTVKAIRWNTSYDLGFATFTYLGGYRHLDYHRMNTLGGAYGTNVQNLVYDANEHVSTWNHEVRLGTNSKGPLFWQVGAFYFDEKNRNYTTFSDFPGGGDLRGTEKNIYIYNYNPEASKSWAVFGQASYELTHGLKAEFGVRYTHDEHYRDGIQSLASLSSYLSTGALNYTTTSASGYFAANKATFHGALDWQFTPHNLLYAKYDTGFKGGGFNNGSTYNPETITAYEVGSKNRFLNNKLQLNLDAFLYNYDNQQVTQYLANSPTSQIVNAGKSRYYGVEAEGVAMLTRRDRLDGYVAYVHGEYLDFAIASGASNLQLAGNRPPQAPRWSMNAGYQHDLDVLKGKLTLRAQTHYETASYFTIYNYAADKQSPYTRSDILVTYQPDGAHWSLEAYVRNLEDSLILANAQNPASTTYKAYRYQYLSPRTFGAKLTYTW